MTNGAEREPARFRLLLGASLLLIGAGLATSAAVLVTASDTLSRMPGGTPADAEGAIAILVWLFVGGVALLVGLLAHAARSVVVREGLSASRYRGPSVLVMLVIAVIGANLAIVPAAGEVAALLGDGELSPLGTLAVLIVTPLALVGVAALFVGAPRGLAGVRLLPERGLWGSVRVGLLLAVPAWIGAQLIGLLAVLLLQLVNLEPDVGVAERALANADPVIIVIAVVLVAPVAEELFFRGVVYNAWLREYGPRAALVGSSVLFALIHGSLFLFLPIAALGVALAVVYRRTGSLPAAIALHAGFNAITVALALLVRYGVLDLPVT